MITILKPGCERIMQIFYANKNKKLHLREIARQSRLHEPSATRFLNVLEKESMLIPEKDGNLKKYSVMKNPKAYLIFEMFDIEKFEKLPYIRKEAIRRYMEKLPEQPVFAVLFGSTAKETYGKGSDIDLLIITNRQIQSKDAEKEADAITGMKISTFQMVYSEFMQELKLKNDKVIQSAISTGYPITNHIVYYKAVCDERI